MTNERQEMLEQSATIYFGPWYRRSPFFDATRRAGCTAYDVYNHMLLPAYFDDPDLEYWALLNDVVVWDVAVERTVEISGPDADGLVNMLTCRDLTKCAVKQGKYMIVTAPDGGILNDPVLLHVGQNRWWMQLADSDAGLYALGVASQAGMDVQVTYPEAYPMQVQGAKAGKTVEKLVGQALYELKYYWCDWFDIEGIPVLISRTGWTALEGVRREGVQRKLVGIEFAGDALRAELSWFWPVAVDGDVVGRVTDAIWSPRLERNIGYVWVPAELSRPGIVLEVRSESGPLTGQTAAIPFIDPKKEVPAAPLEK